MIVAGVHVAGGVLASADDVADVDAGLVDDVA